MASAGDGLAALVYAPSQVTAKVGPQGTEVTVTEKTEYPFREEVTFVIELEKSAEFPFHLRIPEWCASPQVRVNGEVQNVSAADGIVILNRKWQSDDTIQLLLPMRLTTKRWHENSVGFQRGPLVFALKIEEDWKSIDNYKEVHPTMPWNYAVLEDSLGDLEEHYEVVVHDTVAENPWTLETAPIEIRTKGVRLPQWQLYNEMAGPIPWSPQQMPSGAKVEPITLLPFGCTTLRISGFPTVN